MNFDFSDEQRSLQQELRTYLTAASPLSRSRKTLEASAGIDRDLWSEMAELGWLGIGIPERFGGAGLGALELALGAEEVGRALSPVPFGSSVCAATDAIVRYGTEAQQERWLPGLAAGTEIGVLALADAPGPFYPASLTASLSDGRLKGTKVAVADGGAATVAIVACRQGTGSGLALVALDQPAIARGTARSIDPSRSVSTIMFHDAAAEALGDERALDGVLLSAATLQAFEQIGGADAAFAMTREYMDLRQAFDRPISSYQALKHRMADLYAALEIARSNAYYAAWALAAASPQLAEAACCARIAASQAFQLVTVEAIQLHGGIGFTWESDCHLFYRRAKWLAASLGSPDEWRERLVAELDAELR
jgi:alkylation response protein AidB-like acyl-CoA dehydrogenase